MKFVRRDLGVSGEASSGGGIRGLGREITNLLSVAIILGAVFYFGIGWIVEWTLPHISAEREQRWFSSFRTDQSETPPTNDETTSRDYAKGVLAKLTRHPEVPKIDFRLVVVENETTNVFAIPGGTIAVTTGLLDVVGDDEVALAFVLGHEIGHFTQRDHLRGFGRAIGRGLVWMLIFGGNSGIDLISERTQHLLDLGHSRQQENGADQWGIRLVRAVYGTDQGSDQLFQWLATKLRRGFNSLRPTLLRQIASTNFAFTHRSFPTDRPSHKRSLAT